MIPKKSAFVCPVCGGGLFELSGGLRCFAGHSFDRARQGYVNLLLKNASGKRHGDDRCMVAARRRFLEKGYYAPLQKAVSRMLGTDQIVLDAGCGEGYYTACFAEQNQVYGIDISKDAVQAAAGRYKTAAFAVASLAHIPLADQSVDAVVSIFAPEVPVEFARVLRSGGRWITVLPMERHLWELKAAVYNKPYCNPPVKPVRSGFVLTRGEELQYRIALDNTADIAALFQMTPYYYKTSALDQQKLQSLSRLEVGLEFYLAEYQVNP